MSFVKPTTIIALGKRVHDTLKELLGDDVNTKIRLNHPNYCAFPKRYQTQKKLYIEMLEPFLK